MILVFGSFSERIPRAHGRFLLFPIRVNEHLKTFYQVKNIKKPPIRLRQRLKSLVHSVTQVVKIVDSKSCVNVVPVYNVGFYDLIFYKYKYK